MTAAVNPLCRLALRMRLRSCVHRIPQPFKTTLTGSPQRPFKQSPCSRSTVATTRGDDDGLKGYLLNQETAFNIHNPSLDHRAR
jgi:hypothetical protein